MPNPCVPAAAPGLPSNPPTGGVSSQLAPKLSPDPGLPASAQVAQKLHPSNIRQVVRLCADCSAGIRERAAMAYRHNPDETAALRSLAVAIDHVAADWALEHGGAA